VLGLPVGKHFKIFSPNAVGSVKGQWNGQAVRCIAANVCELVLIFCVGKLCVLVHPASVDFKRSSRTLRTARRRSSASILQLLQMTTSVCPRDTALTISFFFLCVCSRPHRRFLRPAPLSPPCWSKAGPLPGSLSRSKARPLALSPAAAAAASSSHAPWGRPLRPRHQGVPQGRHLLPAPRPLPGPPPIIRPAPWDLTSAMGFDLRNGI
jgi:hypothetical protein